MDDLNLDETQKAKMQELKKDFGEKMKELNSTYESQIESILTPEQKQKWDEHKDKRLRPFDGRKDQFRSEKPKMQILSLDDDTRAKIKALKEDFRKKKQAVELSRIAPDAQKQKIEELTKQYQADKKALIENALQKKKSE
jgi:Spy/CpxP family protein refolding chaperone